MQPPAATNKIPRGLPRGIPCANKLSRSLHGTCVAIDGKGIFLTGKPGAGKSLIALNLLKRGYQLISDDLTTITKIENNLIASCPPTIKNWLYVRNIGFINVAKTFGKKAIAETATIELVIDL